MSGVEVPAGVLPVGANVELVEDQRSGRLDGPLYRVVGVQSILRDLRQVDGATGALEGVEVRYVVNDLRPARPFVVRRYEALSVRAVRTTRKTSASSRSCLSVPIDWRP